MPKEYFYGEQDKELYTDTSVQSAIENAIENGCYPIGETIKIIELASSRTEERWCENEDEFIEIQDHCEGCEEKEYIGKSHICKYLSYGLRPTGAEWAYTVTRYDFDQEQFKIDLSRIKKISERK